MTCPEGICGDNRKTVHRRAVAIGQIFTGYNLFTANAIESLIERYRFAARFYTGDMFEKQALDAVVDYTKYHFQREEELMAKHDYPLLEAHKAEHERMIAKVGGYISSYEKTGHKALEDLGDFLKDWLVNHINGTDKAYGPFLNERGVH